MVRSSAIPMLVAVCLSSALQSQDKPERYRDQLFDSVEVKKDIPYGVLPVHLLDLYRPPARDEVKNRPLVIYIHGGGFRNQTKVGVYQTRACMALAKMGYVVASIEYRLTNPIPDSTAYLEAMLRGLQDAKGAVRYFRREASVYGIDPNRVYAMGSSAGSMIALHLAYLDSAEVPSYLQWVNVGGSFEGRAGSPGYSSAIQGVINCWGAIGDTSWMKGSTVPVFSVHGLNDTTVFYDRVPSYKVFRYGSKHISESAKRLGILTGERLFPNTGHTLDNNTAKQDSAIQDFSRWLYGVQKSTLRGGVQ